jgi:hypothetical protein
MIFLSFNLKVINVRHFNVNLWVHGRWCIRHLFIAASNQGI